MWYSIELSGKNIGCTIPRKKLPLLYRFVTVYTQFANKIMKHGIFIYNLPKNYYYGNHKQRNPWRILRNSR